MPTTHAGASFFPTPNQICVKVGFDIPVNVSALWTVGREVGSNLTGCHSCMVRHVHAM